LCRLRFQAYSTAPAGVWDDILYAVDYVIAPTVFNIPAADATNQNHFNVLTYNIYMRPTSLFNDDQTVRSQYLIDKIRGFDAVIFVEMFDNAIRDQMLRDLAVEYPFQSNVVDNPNNPIEDGGVLIVSKFPIEREEQLLWGNNCNADDCLANKGIRYARINKLGRKYHVFGTHMDAFNDPDDVNMRLTQMTLFNDFVRFLNFSPNEAVLMGGDFNVERIRNQLGEYDSLFTRMHCVLPQYLGHQDATWDVEHNYYNARETVPQEYLDYIMPHNEYHRPTISQNTPVILRSSHDDMWRIFDLSDHHPVWGHFEYPYPISVENQSNSSDLVCYPNPFLSNQPFIIKGEFESSEIMEINFINSLGENIFSTQQLPVDDSTIKIEGLNLAKGMYFVKLQTNKGLKVAKLLVF
jgi:endonuclease/exonuclease/phosphatase family metal-dependent hydrolase